MGRLISATGFCLPTGRLPMTRQNAFRDTLTLPLLIYSHPSLQSLFLRDRSAIMDRMQGHAITAAYAAALVGVAFKVNAIVKDPYMDEIFHVPQAQRYCKGDFWTWDPMITTPPGLYLASSSIAIVAQWIKQDLCTTAILRATNIAFSTGILVVVAKLLHVLHPGTDKSTINLYALALACFPVSMFYTFVYYTDSGSTFFVLLSYLLSKQRKYMLSGLVALISLSFRQTNIIWLVFTMGNSVIDLLSVESKKTKSTALFNPKAAELSSLSQCLQSASSLLTNAIFNLHKLIPQLATYIISICSFLAFLYWNKGIVLGDHSAHVAGLHLPQLFYFIAFLTFFTLPLTVGVCVQNQIKSLFHLLMILLMRLSLITSAGVGLTMLALIHKF
ncbi:hypothetical protein INT43_006320, partial [Umbelopsis isabellina]